MRPTWAMRFRRLVTPKGVAITPWIWLRAPYMIPKPGKILSSRTNGESGWKDTYKFFSSRCAHLFSSRFTYNPSTKTRTAQCNGDAHRVSPPITHARSNGLCVRLRVRNKERMCQRMSSPQLIPWFGKVASSLLRFREGRYDVNTRCSPSWFALPEINNAFNWQSSWRQRRPPPRCRLFASTPEVRSKMHASKTFSPERSRTYVYCHLCRGRGSLR